MPIVALARMRYAAHSKNQFNKSHCNLLALHASLPFVAIAFLKSTGQSAVASLCRTVLPYQKIGSKKPRTELPNEPRTELSNESRHIRKKAAARPPGQCPA